ncbi:Ankrd17, partial [Symbiodinium sp. KB8]
ADEDRGDVIALAESLSALSQTQYSSAVHAQAVRVNHGPPSPLGSPQAREETRRSPFKLTGNWDLEPPGPLQPRLPSSESSEDTAFHEVSTVTPGGSEGDP